MIKRPFLLLLFAYVAGSLFYLIPFILVLLLVVLLLLGISFMLFHYSRNRYDFSLLMMPVLFLFGYLLMGNQRLPGPVDELLTEGPVYTTCTGTISDVVKKEASYQILLSEVIFSDSLYNTTGSYDTTCTIYVYAKEIPTLSIGNGVKVTGKLSLFTSPTNPGQFDERLYYKIQDIDYRMMATDILRTNTKVKPLKNGLYILRESMNAVYEAMKDSTTSVLTAMLLGDTKTLEDETKSLYQAAGISHIISISGMHITLLGMAIFALVAKVFGCKWGIVATSFFILVYGMLTGFRIATNRAVVMMLILLGARLAGRTYDLLSAIALSALVILIRQPMQIYQTGFLLSYGAILAIGICYPVLMSLVPIEEIKKRGEHVALSRSSRRRALLYKSYILGKCRLATILIFQLSIQITLLPLLLISYYRLPIYSFLMNLIVVPLMDYVIIIGLPSGVIGCICLPLARFLLSSTHYIIEFSNALCSLVYRLPAYYYVAGQPATYELMVYVVLVVLGLILASKGRKVCFLCFLTGMAVLLIRIPEKGILKITALDVGQGDCFVMETPNQKIYVIDGGSVDVGEVGKYRLLPFLYAKGRNRVDCWMVTHCDKDHISAFMEVLQNVRDEECSIGTLVLPKTSYEDDNYDALVEEATEAGVPIMYLERGLVLKEGDLSLRCLHPSNEYKASNANDYSLALSVSYGEFDMLFTGDIEAEGEASMEELLQKEYEVLKVAHHGSKNSTNTSFLKKVAPRIGIISCGRNNSYGHPHKELLNRLKEAGCKVYMTQNSGAIEIQTDGRKFWVDEYISTKEKVVQYNKESMLNDGHICR